MTTVTLPIETIERVTDALNKLTGVAAHVQAHREWPSGIGNNAIEDARTALRELATMTSAGTGAAENIKAERDDAREARDHYRAALQSISGMCADQYPNAQRQIERIQDVADKARGLR